MFIAGCSFIQDGPSDPVDPTDDTVNPEPGPDTKPYTADEHWDALAKLVSSGGIRHTDEIIWVAERLKSLNYLTDITRVDKYRKKMVTLDESNRDFTANALRGA